MTRMKSKMTKILSSVAAATVLSAGLMVGGAGPASAGYATLGPGYCTAPSSVATRATGNYAITFTAYVPNRGGYSTTTGVSTDPVVRVKSVYWVLSTGLRVDTVSSGTVSNRGTLSNAGHFCDY